MAHDADEPRAHSARSPTSVAWLAAGAGLVGVLFGGAAVMLGLSDRTPPTVPPPAAGEAPPVPVASTPQPAPVAAQCEPSLTSAVLAAPSAPTLAEAVATTRDAVVNIGTRGTLGAGVIVDAEGTILTNFHVIADALRLPGRGMFVGGETAVVTDTPSRPTVTARFEDGRELAALVVVADADQDLAILRLIPDDPDERFAAVGLGSSEAVVVGQEVFAIGNPFGLSHTVSRGIVSAVDRTNVLANRVPLLQLDASINVGNSGGPLFDLSGGLLGIVTAKNREGQGIAFAVPVDHLRGFLRAVADPHGGRRSGAIGISMDAQAELSEAARTLGYDTGLLVSSVESGSPADTAGLRQGDILVEVRGKRLDGLTEASDPSALARHVAESVRSLFPGETLDVAVVRDAQVQEVSLEIGAAPPERQALIDAEELLGLELADGSRPGEAPRVLAVGTRSPLAQAGPRLVGARVVKLMNRDVRSTEDLGEELSRIRVLLRSQAREVQVLIGFADPDGRPLGEAHVMVG